MYECYFVTKVHQAIEFSWEIVCEKECIKLKRILETQVVILSITLKWLRIQFRAFPERKRIFMLL